VDDADQFATRGQRALRRVWRALEGPPNVPTYWLVREWILRSLGFVYLVAFASAATQVRGLIGPHGILPAQRMLDAVADKAGSRWQGFVELPSVFWIDAGDTTLTVVCWIGAALALAVILGYGHAAILAALWIVQLSLDHVGQRWWSFGWENQLLETGFLAIFMGSTKSLRTLDVRAPPSKIPIVLMRWLIARIMLGAGLIKLRGDPCWVALTCLEYHFETQPIPNPGGWLMHRLPAWILHGGVVLNHAAELAAPFFVFGPRRARLVAGVVMIAFQLTLVVSGNLAFLNWLTLVPCIACFDDAALRRLVPPGWARAVVDSDRLPPASRARTIITAIFASVVAYKSIDVVVNLISPGQAMNRSYDRFALVNTYGAFGRVDRERLELVIEGTDDATPDDAADWRPYELPCKPGDPERRPCQVSPWHYRLDWLMWFAALDVADDGVIGRERWLSPLLDAVARGEPAVLSLFARVPFPRGVRWVRIVVYRYRFTAPGEPGWWHRERLGALLFTPPSSARAQ
jgi:hypothetical protein